MQTAVLKILNKEWDTITNLEEQLGADDEKLLQRAVSQQLSLGHSPLERGLLCNESTNAQEEWSISQGTSRKVRASRTYNKVIIALQTFTLNLWKDCNTYIHGTNKEENREAPQLKQCHKSIDELYHQDLSLFTLEQQNIFKVPKKIRKKEGLEAMSPRISTAELLMTTRTKEDQMT